MERGQSNKCPCQEPLTKMELELSAADKSVAQILKTTVGDICIEGKAISILGDILRSCKK